MAATSSIRIVKSFSYRGATRNFSNRYHLGTAVPPDSAHWTTLADAIVAAEKAIYQPPSSFGATIIEAVGYAPGSEVPVFTKAYSVVGTGAFISYSPVPGDTAAVIRYATPDRSTKNHPIYCFNYYHTIGCDPSVGTHDQVIAGQLTALQTYAAHWLSGFSDGATNFIRSRPSGDLCTGSFVNPLLTHRDLPR
jgi:hypothetical protein